MKNTVFFKQAELMLKVLPHVMAETCFALKGGTAINMFVRALPRLSVDIDLAYLPIEEPRDTALTKISEALNRIAQEMTRRMPGVRVQKAHNQHVPQTTKLIVVTPQARIKIEPNLVIRGTVHPVEERTLHQSAEQMFELSVTVPTLSISDLYGGKLCAAFDRQHPRDWFDMWVLLQHEGLTAEIRKGFIVYLASHDRPMSELLHPTWKDMKKIYDQEFVGMTVDHVNYEDLLLTRTRCLEMLRKGITDREKEFLISLKQGLPKWECLDLEGVEHLPAIRWKLQNIQKMQKEKHRDAIEKLKKVLDE